jgi:hypothetical protein
MEDVAKHLGKRPRHVKYIAQWYEVRYAERESVVVDPLAEYGDGTGSQEVARKAQCYIVGYWLVDRGGVIFAGIVMETLGTTSLGAAADRIPGGDALGSCVHSLRCNSRSVPTSSGESRFSAGGGSPFPILDSDQDIAITKAKQFIEDDLVSLLW